MPAETRAEDIALMRQAGITMVTAGVFSWAQLEHEPGVYTFGRLDEVIEDRAGIAVCLATPTASPPAWFARRRPESVPVTRDGVRLGIGSREAFCPSSPAAVPLGGLTVFREQHMELKAETGRNPVDAWDIEGIAGQYECSSGAGARCCPASPRAASPAPRRCGPEQRWTPTSAPDDRPPAPIELMPPG